MNLCFLLAAAIFLTATSASAVGPLGPVSLESKTSLRSSQVAGPGRATSFWRNGTFLTEEPTLRLDAASGVGWRAEGESRLRFTHDRLVDQRGFSVESLSLTLNKGSHTVTLGDYFAVLSQYSMSQLLKGIGWQRTFDNPESYVRATAGTFDSQWEFLYTDDQFETVNRYGGGLRAQKASDSWRIGTSWAVVQDERTDPLRRKNASDAFYQNTGALDWEWRPGGATLSGEHATNTTVRMPYSADKRQTHGHANNLRAAGDLAGTRWSAQFENVSPNFTSLAGSASTDRRRYNAQFSRRLGPVWQAFTKWSLTHDRTEGQPGRNQTTNTAYDAGLTRYRLFGRKALEASGAWRRSQTHTSNRSRLSVADRIQLSASDQVTKAVRIKASIEPTLEQNTLASRNSRQVLYELRATSRHRLKSGWSLSGQLSGRRQDVENLATLGDDVQHGASARLEASRPGGLTLGAEADHGVLDLHNGVDSRTSRARLFAGSQIPRLKGAQIDFDVMFNRYDFTSVGTDYNETVGRLSLTWRM